MAGVGSKRSRGFRLRVSSFPLLPIAFWWSHYLRLLTSSVLTAIASFLPKRQKSLRLFARESSFFPGF